MLHLKDRQFETFISQKQIKEKVTELALRINQDYAGKELVFIVILNGSFMFAADLLKQITLTCRISFIKVSSYQHTQSTGNLTELIGLQENITQKDVVVIEDIVDTALTMDNVRQQLLQHRPASLEISTLLCKQEAMQRDIYLKYVGFTIPNRFVVGYGLDYDGIGRNYPEIYAEK